jgi:hypothetical protein
VKVYVVEEGYAYDGNNTVSMHATLSGAKRAAARQMMDANRSRQRWQRVRGTHSPCVISWYSAVLNLYISISSYEVQW